MQEMAVGWLDSIAAAVALLVAFGIDESRDNRQSISPQKWRIVPEEQWTECNLHKQFQNDNLSVIPLNGTSSNIDGTKYRFVCILKVF